MAGLSEDIFLRFDESSLKELFEPVIESLGFEYWGLELLNHGRNMKIRLYIEAEAGVGIDDCALVSGHISDLLDVEADFAMDYSLEVSSPGMDRILFCKSHYTRHVGERVELKLLKMFDGQKNYEGLLKGTEDDCVVIEIKDEEYLFPIEDIGKIRVIPIFE